MAEDMKAWQIRHGAYDFIWHIRLAATVLGHALDRWGGVAAVVQNAPAEVRAERTRCMNIIGGLCGQLKTSLNILAGQEDRFDPEGTIAKLIEYCDIAMADLRVSPLLELLKEPARK